MMKEDILTIISLIKKYLENAVASKGFFDNVIEYVLPIFSMIVVIVGGIWTVYTYVIGKNKEVNKKILEEVYSPLYQIYVTNDALIQIGDINIDYKEVPFIEWDGVKIHKTIKEGVVRRELEKKDSLGLSRTKFVSAIDKMNLGLAPKGLVTLVSAYKSVNYAIEHLGDEEEIYMRAIEYRNELEYAIRVEVYEGYKKYYKKLGLHNNEKKQIFEICDDHIKLKLKSLTDREEKKFEEN